MSKILDYQKLDIEYHKLKRASNNSTEKNNMSKLKGYIVDAHDKGLELEKNAKKLLDDYTNLKKQYDNNYKKVQELLKKDISTISLDDVDNTLSLINSLSGDLFSLERNLNIIINKIKSSLKEFEITKNNIIKAKNKYKESKSKYEKEIENSTPRVKEIQSKMSELEKEIDSETLNKYKTMKGDKIFPVFVPFDNGHCSGCRVEIPTSKVNKLKKDGTIVCEQCHRIIFMK